MLPGRDGRPERIRYSLPRHKRGTWVGPGRKRKATAPGEQGVVDLPPGEFLDRLADLVPPPRRHRHRYHGVFAPNHPLRPTVTAPAIGNLGTRADAASPLTPADGRGERTPDAPPRSHDTSRVAWAKLIARIAEDFPLEPPPLAPTRGPPAGWHELVQAHDDRDAIQAPPDDLPVIDIRSL